MDVQIRTVILTHKCQCCPHIETSQLICTANQLTGFYMRATLALNGLNIHWYNAWFSWFYFTTCFKNDPATLNFNDLYKIWWKLFFIKFAWVLKRRRKYALENMQHHIESINFGLFLNLNISRIPHLGESTFWIYTYNFNDDI